MAAPFTQMTVSRHMRGNDGSKHESRSLHKLLRIPPPENPVRLAFNRAQDSNEV